jgi:hypothetical protein
VTDNNDKVKINWPKGMSASERDNLSDILQAFDVAASDLEKDHRVIFPSESEQLGFFHAAQKKWLKRWSKPGPCMHEGCSEQSIARSHTIPMSASLKLIAENGHVVTPIFQGERGLRALPIGIREASTFPGFCEQHEMQFAAFESTKAMTTEKHFQLQAFRTLCREIYTKRHHKQKFEALLADYRERRAAFITRRLKEVPSQKPIDIKRIEFKNDATETLIANQLEDLNKDLLELERLYRGLRDDMKNGTDNLSMTVMNFNMRLPVCLSGLGVINYVEADTRRRALCFLAVIPEDQETKVIVGALTEHANAIAHHLRDQSSLAFLERIESWMVHGSDHWFMTPSAWGAIPDSRQEAICARILDASGSIADAVEFSILDEPRRRVVELMERSLADGSIPVGECTRVKDALAEEKAKLSYEPGATKA